MAGGSDLKRDPIQPAAGIQRGTHPSLISVRWKPIQQATFLSAIVSWGGGWP